MRSNDEMPRLDEDQAGRENKEPRGRRVATDMTITQDDLQRELFVDTDPMPVREGQPAGGQNFGKSNTTSGANDKNNPSQYAGNTNAYFDRTEPSEEHPEYSNFRDPLQQGSPDYDKANAGGIKNSSEPKPDKVQRGNGKNDRPSKGTSGDEKTANDDDVNIPGPGELPDQQKVGEDVEGDDRDHIET